MSEEKEYFFVLGRNPELSILELIAYLKNIRCEFEFTNKTKYKLKDKIGYVIILTIKGKFNAFKAAKILAGTIKIGEIYIKSALNQIWELLDDANFYLEDKNKISYSIEYYGKISNQESYHSYFKKQFKSLKQKAFLKKLPPHALLNSLKANTFIDIVVIKPISSENYYIGRTSAVYDITDDKIRYERRPFVDETIGTSPRIARILVNLSRLSGSGGKILLDPFCGIGTILQEALIFNYTVNGIELDPKRVNQCKNNLNWLIKYYNLKNSVKPSILAGDAQYLMKIYDDETFDTIVTEPFLGPFLKSNPTPTEAKSYTDSLSRIYKNFFLGAWKILKTNGVIVMILPRFITTKNKIEKINIKSIIPSGDLVIYQIIDQSIDNEVIGDLNLKIPLSYKEKWHKIDRQIYIFKKNLPK